MTDLIIFRAAGDGPAKATGPLTQMLRLRPIRQS